MGGNWKDNADGLLRVMGEERDFFSSFLSQKGVCELMVRAGLEVTRAGSHRSFKLTKTPLVSTVAWLHLILTNCLDTSFIFVLFHC